MFWFYASARKIEIKKSDTLVSDSINVYPCKFQFSNDWNGLTKTAVFKAGSQAVEVLLDGECQCEIPWEVLLKDKLDLYVGCYGTQGEDIILNTTWTNVGKIYEGTKNKAVPGEDPTPDIYTQLASQIGDLSSLETEDKSNLVNAINEVNAKTGEVESNLDTKVDVTGGTVTGPIMFAEDSPSMTYMFEDEPVEDDNTQHGTIISSDGIMKDSPGPLHIRTSFGFVDFDNDDSHSVLIGVSGDENIPDSVPNMQQMKEAIPIKTSQLQNDSGFLTAEDIPDLPSNPSDDIPTKLSQLQNDVGYITESDIPPIPDKTSQLINDSGFITEDDIPTIPTVPTKTSELENDSNFATEQYVQDQIAEIEVGEGVVGPPGPAGEDGKDGKDGFSPTVSTSINENQDGVDVTITDLNGEHSFTILNGENGNDGQDATINGENTIEIVAGDNVSIEQNGNVLTISSYSAGNIYSTEERVIGTWLDGKPEYQKTILFSGVVVPYQSATTIFIDQDIDVLILGWWSASNGGADFSNGSIGLYPGGKIEVLNNLLGGEQTLSGFAIIQYTKKSDLATIALPAMLSATLTSVTSAPASAVTAKFNIGNEEV